MAWIRHVTLLILLKQIICKDCVIDNTTPDSAWESKLYKDLKCNYIIGKAPVINYTESVKVAVKFDVRYFSFDSNEEAFSMYSWVHLQWNDYRLKWNPDDYKGIDHITISSTRIWIPKFTLLNALNDELLMGYIFTTCDIKNNGAVKCIPKFLYEIECSSKLKNWPYDTQKCRFEFGELTGSESKVAYSLFSVGTIGINGLSAEYGANWDIVDIIMTENSTNTNRIQITLTFEVERQAEGLAAIIVIPSLIVCVLTMSSLLLDFKENVRLFMVCFSLLIHYSLLSEFSDVIRKHSADTPTVLLFIRGSIILTMFVTILTFILSFLSRRRISPPLYVKSLNKYVFEGYVKHIIWPRWEADLKILISEDSNETVLQWSDFSNIMNSVSLIVFAFVYVCMFLAYMPKHTPTIRIN